MAARALGLSRSSAIEGATYDEESGTLTVTFSRGGTYTYNNVPPNLAEQFERAPSPGSFVFRYLKDWGG